MKADLVPALQEKLDAALSSRTQLEKDVERSSKEIVALQEQLKDVSAQKDEYESQLEQNRSSFEELAADIQELKGVKERVAALEGDLATKDQALSQASQKITDLTSALAREKTSKETLDSERTIKADLVAELQGKLEAALSDRAELENDVEKSRKEIAALQSQLRERKAQQTPTKPSPAIVDVKKDSPSKSEAFTEQGEPLSPNDVIDWLFKQKAK
jgi:chromosome segregation ATPase